MRRLLVIGGSGFVSGTLARTALESGWAVWAVTRGQRPLPSGVKGLVADRHDVPAFGQRISDAGTDWDLVVDCIGYKPEDARQDIEVFHDRAAHLVFISTDFVFDPARRCFPQPEDTHWYLEAGYGGDKRRCELEFLRGVPGDMAWTVVRPCHIYGPGSLLGCLPQHGRDAELVARLQRGEALELVGGGYFLQQPIFARDLARLILSCSGNSRSHGGIYNTAGPDIIESRDYYRIIADALGRALRIDEVPVAEFLAEHPEKRSFLCHRIYDLARIREHGLCVPSTSITDGLREHLASLMP